MSNLKTSVLAAEIQDMIDDGLIETGPTGLEFAEEAQERMELLSVKEIEISGPYEPRTLH